jgi:hypothetical protein
VPTSWQASLAVHTTGFDPMHAPPAQASVVVQPFASLQAVPSGAAGFEHSPVPGLHVPAMWHASLGVQITGFAPEHAPD